MKPRLRLLVILIVFYSCSSSLHNGTNNSKQVDNNITGEQPVLPADAKPVPLSDLARTKDGGYVLAPGFYETAFKTYCLQPGTPDPSEGDAYLQGPVSGYRKEIVETILLNSRKKPDLPQRNIQLLLWSVVSRSNYNKLSASVQATAMQLLSAKQIFELKGGVMGMVKNVSYASGILNANSDMQKLFNLGSDAYEVYERTAVLKASSKVKHGEVKYDQWYRQRENYYIRYFPLNYQRVKIQVYVPDGLLDSTGKYAGDYVVYDPTGLQAMPANTNAQRLGIGAPVLDIIKIIIETNKGSRTPKNLPGKNPTSPKADS